MWVDSHCHLTFDDEGGDIQGVLSRAYAAGVGHFLTICCTTQEIEPLKTFAMAHDQVSMTVGVHPHEATETLSRFTDSELYDFLKTAALQPKVVGLGEMGYDFHYNHSSHEDQQRVFDVQLRLATDLDLPVSIHTRAAEAETLQHLKQYPQVRGVIHCFSGTEFLARGALELGFYVSLSGILTFPKAQEIRDCLSFIPLEKILVETDAPFLAPVPYRGKRNEPAYLIETAQVIAQLKQISLETLEKATTQNFFDLFKKAIRPAGSKT